MDYLAQLVGDQYELSKLKGLYYALRGVITFRQNRYVKAIRSFSLADEETRKFSKKADLFKRSDQSFLEQVLRLTADTGNSAGEEISPSFIRDLYFLAALAQLRMVEVLVGSSQIEWKSAMCEAEKGLEQSIAVNPNFDAGRAMLGMLYCYLGNDEARRNKGFEILQTVRHRVGSKFVSQTVSQYGTLNRSQQNGLRQDPLLLPANLQISDIPSAQRKVMQNHLLDQMKATGQYEAFVGRRDLVIGSYQEPEPTVQECLNRASLLHEKLERAGQMNSKIDFTLKVSMLKENLKLRSQALQNQLQIRVDVEQQLLAEIRHVLDRLENVERYKDLIVREILEIEAETEQDLTLSEIITRMARLRKTLKGLEQADESGELTSRTRELAETMETNNQTLQRQLEEITKIEQQLISETRNLLYS